MKSVLKYVPITTFVRPTILVSFLCVLFACVVNSLAQDFRTIHDGVEYAQVSHRLGEDPVKINLLRLDLKKVRLDVHHAFDKAIGTEKTSSIATRHEAVAAINAGFFRLDNSKFAGDSTGALMIDGELLSEDYARRTAVYLDNRRKITELYLMPVRLVALVGVEGKESPQPISGINRPRRDNEMVLFGPLFGKTTLTPRTGTEVLFNRCKRKLGKADGIKGFANVCESLEIRQAIGNAPISSDGYVLSIGPGEVDGKADLLRQLVAFPSRPDKKKRLFIRFQVAFERNFPFLPNENLDVVAGVPQLIKNSKIDITWEQEKASKAFVETRHPRTAVAKLKGGKFLMMTVDGRQPGVSVGMSLQELAEYLLSLGAVDAMNLDGGGSTTMFLDGKVVNTPSDKEGERKIGDAILVTLRKKPAVKK